jgi:hypothetical protein
MPCLYRSNKRYVLPGKIKGINKAKRPRLRLALLLTNPLNSATKVQIEINIKK